MDLVAFAEFLGLFRQSGLVFSQRLLGGGIAERKIFVFLVPFGQLLTSTSRQE